MDRNRAWTRGWLTLVTVALLAGPSIARADGAADARAVAEQFIQRYRELENGADEALADLYDDEARFVQIETEADGTTSEDVMPPKSRKRIIAATMTVARIQPYSASYVIEQVEREGDRIRIRTQRHTEPGKFNSRRTFVIAQTPQGAWQIVEQIAEFGP